MKKFYLVILSLLAVFALAALAACGGSNGGGSGNGGKTPTGESADVEENGITLSSSSITMDIFSEAKLRAFTDISGKVTWNSSAPEIAEVSDDGVVTSKGVTGTAKITALVGGKSAECTVTTQIVGFPELKLTSNKAVLNSVFGDEKFEVGYTLTYNGTDVSADYPVKWVLADDADDGVAAIATDERGNAFFSPVENGFTEYVAYAEMDGKIAVDKIEITVIELDYTMNVSGVSPTEGGYRADLYTYGGVKEIELSVEKYDIKTGAITPVAYTWTTVDKCVDIIGGIISAANEGEAVVVGKADGYEDIVIIVNVIKPKVSVEVEEEIVFEIRSGEKQSLNVSEYDLVGNVINAYFDGQSVFSSYTRSTGEIKLDFSSVTNAASKLGKTKLIIETDKISYTFPVTAYSLIVDTKEELGSLRNIAKISNGVFDGYYILGADIDCAGLKDILCDNNLAYADGFTFGFRGVFDGRGHVLKSVEVLTASSDSFFGMTLAETGVIRNVVFTDIKLSGSSSVITTYCYGTLSNLYMKFAYIAGGAVGGALCGNWAAAASPVNTNIVVDYSGLVLNSPSYFPTTKNFTASTSVIYAIVSGNYIRENASGGSVLNGNHYPSYAELKQDKTAQAVFASWDNEFWDVSLGVPFPLALVDEIKAKANEEIVVEGAEKQGDYQVVKANSGESLELKFNAVGAVSVTLSPEAAKAGIRLKGNTIIIPDVSDGSIGGTYVVTLASLFNSSNVALCKLVVNEYAYAMYNDGERVTIDLDVGYDATGKATANAAATAEIALGSAYVGTLDEVKVDGVSYGTDGFTLSSDGKLKINTAVFGTSFYGEKTLTAYISGKNGGVAVKVNVLIISKAIDTVDELQNLAKYAYQGGFVWDGYFLLGMDVDCEKDLPSNFGGLFLPTTAMTDAQHRDGENNGFMGVFDGNGHVISNFVSKKATCGFFGYTLGISGVIKNVAFTNVNIAITNGPSVIAKIVFGTVQDVYIGVSHVETGANGAAIASVWQEGGTAKTYRVFIDYTDAGELNAPLYFPTTKQYSADSTIVAVVKGEYYTKAINGSLYASREELKNVSSLFSWANHFWTIVNGVPTPIALAQ